MTHSRADEIQIVPYEPAMAAEIAMSYNKVIRGVPHCYPVSAEEFAAAAARTEAQPQGDKPMHSKAAFVARDAASVLGFVDVGIGWAGDDGAVEQGVIQFLWYERGHRKAGQALLATAEDYLRERKMNQVQAFPQEYRYPFYYLESAYLSDHLGHVAALLAFNGYQRVRGEVYLDWPDFEPVDPSPADVVADISVELRHGRRTRPELILKARQGDKEIGFCGCVSGGEYSRCDEAQDWMVTYWVWVLEEMRGKGLGRHLLQRALQEARGIGYRHAAISTAWDNPRAFLFYSNQGYAVVDWTYGFGRELTQTLEQGPS